MTGLFIAFEGLEKSGKSSAARAVYQKLKEQGYPVIPTREPGGTDVGNALREIVLSDIDMTPAVEMLVFSASRAQHVEKVIAPALEEGKIVICDRYAGTTYAFQGGGRGLPVEDIQAVQNVATRGVWPDLTILLDISVQTSLARIDRYGEIQRFEKVDPSFMERARAAYLRMSDNPSWAVVSNEGTEQEAQEKVFAAVMEAVRKSGIQPASGGLADGDQAGPKTVACAGRFGIVLLAVAATAGMLPPVIFGAQALPHASLGAPGWTALLVALGGAAYLIGYIRVMGMLSRRFKDPHRPNDRAIKKGEK